MGHPADAVRFPERTGTTLARIWQIAPGYQEGEMWAGTEPSALFRSVDGGETFTMNDGLWDHPHRESWAPGGGGQAIHTVLPHPTKADDLLVAMSTGGVYRSGDGGTELGAAEQGDQGRLLPRPAARSWPVRAQGGPEPGEPRSAVRAEPRRGVPQR